jgi:AcrR family transcriptional regulator
MTSARQPATRSYHHGDLREALVRAGFELAGGGGSAAVTLRAATRLAGVSPTAAYRHFSSHEELQFAVGMLALGDLARAIERCQAAAVAADPRDTSRARLVGVGDGYIGFALDSPGAFDIAMFGLFTMVDAAEPASTGDTGRTPYQLLTDAVGSLIAESRLPAAAADPAAITCWSTVHGFATLATRGPLREFPREQLNALGHELVRNLVDGLLTSPPGVSGRAG